jgi:hypothetical protein
MQLVAMRVVLLCVAAAAVKLFALAVITCSGAPRSAVSAELLLR